MADRRNQAGWRDRLRLFSSGGPSRVDLAKDPKIELIRISSEIQVSAQLHANPDDVERARLSQSRPVPDMLSLSKCTEAVPVSLTPMPCMLPKYTIQMPVYIPLVKQMLLRYAPL